MGNDTVELMSTISVLCKYKMRSQLHEELRRISLIIDDGPFVSAAGKYTSLNAAESEQQHIERILHRG